MGQFEFGVDQAAFDAAFGGLSLVEATALILGDKPLSPEQAECLHLAAGNYGYRLLFVPHAVGHVGFVSVATKGCGNRGFLILTPATPECRRAVNAQRRRRWADVFGLPQGMADRLFTACRGHEPTLQAASMMLHVTRHATLNFKNNRTWRALGFRPSHPVEGRALRALREVGLV